MLKDDHNLTRKLFYRDSNTTLRDLVTTDSQYSMYLSISGAQKRAPRGFIYAFIHL